MNKVYLLLLLVYFSASLNCISLKEVYDAAPADQGYDKYLDLETGVIYEGGLFIGNVFNRFTNEYEGDLGDNVMIKGNGAILDLQGQQITISYTDKRLDIEDCVIINGNIRYRGVNSEGYSFTPIGSVKQVTFYQPHDYAVRLQASGVGIVLENNISIDALATGDDYVAISGFPLEWLPTGITFALDLVSSLPEMNNNFSYFNNETTNADSVWHFSQL